MAYGNGGQLGNPFDAQAITKAAPQQTVGMFLESTDKQVEDLQMAITDLEQRLSPILSAVPPSEAGGVNAQIASGSAVVEALRRHGFKIEAAIMRLREITRRIEL